MSSTDSDTSVDELAAESIEDFSISRPSKRRKLNNELADDFESESDDSIGVTRNSAFPSGSRNGTRGSQEVETLEEKPKSKYRIHVPKNGSIPRDDFYTQPPQRSSSPYRIEPFAWQKPIRVEQSRNDKLGATGPATTPLAKPTGDPENADTTNGQRGQQARAETKNRTGHERIAHPAEGYDELLADLPSDAFSSPERLHNGSPSHPITISSQQYVSLSQKYSQSTQQRLRAPQNNLRQTTLFGQQTLETASQSQSTRRRNWPLANKDEPPTHHELDNEALSTWVYPTNLGTIRDYQYSIVAKGLYHNLLVALPTGLGKTFIAATVMLNWFRWTKKAQVVFVAPTRPLVAQQVKACFEIAGIPRVHTTMLTGNTQTGIRAEEWQMKRVFFMTPQTLINDLKSGICDPKKIILLVVDEAHRATGNYAYVEVVKFLKRFNTSFRVLALTATPGASIETVQEVIDGLSISRIEIRTEESLDIRQYVHSRKIDTVLFDNSDEMVMVMDLFAKALQPILNKLNGLNAYWNKDPMTLHPYGCNQARGAWMQSDAGRKANFGLKGMVNSIFTLLASLAQGIELLKYHGIGPFFQKVVAFRKETLANGDKGSRYKKEIIESVHFQTLMSRVQSWVNNDDFVGHPKLEYLQSVVMNHFLDAGNGQGEADPSRTRIMVFAHFRDSAEEIVRVLGRNDPMVRPHVFVGQANSKNSEGMDQATQLAVIKKFQDGIYNVLVATSIGEEGLDIGQVDLIVCYDASASPIRMLQRMGRTGRKRAGNIVVTLMKGKEENNFVKAKDNYEKMQHEIAAGTRFTFHDDSSRRIVPRSVQPVADKRIIDIPFENTQPDLPEPKKRVRPPKKPAKKFNMPDNVRTGFVKASRIDEPDDSEVGSDTTEVARLCPIASPEPMPSLEEVLLTAAEEKELERTYLDVEGDAPQIVAVPRVDSFPQLQRSERPVQNVEHGQLSRNTIIMLQNMHESKSRDASHYERKILPIDRRAGIAQAERRAAFSAPSQSRRGSNSPGRHPQRSILAEHDQTADLESPPDGRISVEFGTIKDNCLRVVSSEFSPTLRASSRRPFYVPPSQLCDGPSLSDDDLPEFGALVNNTVAGATAASDHDMEARVIQGHQRHRARRKIMEDDSSEE